jgi:hypothetical protein
MKFSELLLAALRRSGISPRAESYSEREAAAPIVRMLQAWVARHLPEDGEDSEFDAGYRALAVQLLAELDDSANLPE